jgi:phosphoglycerol transferase MdoB-like AlkP superfamily enzyme
MVMTLKPKTIMASRFAILIPAYLISLPIFFIFRLFLVFRHSADLEHALYIIYALLIGIVDDVAFLSYLSIPFVVYLWLMPERLYRSAVNRIFVQVIFFTCLYVLYFDIIAEWLFWNEFGVRFNFIAVDYLIYTHEVINNIIESYPLSGLLGGILLFTLFTFLLFRKRINIPAYHMEEGFLSRSKNALVLFMLPIVSYAAVNQSLHEISQNRFVNEIAANGPYQFFAAFRNNVIDYRHFYALDDDRLLSLKIRDLVGADKLASDIVGLYDIKHQVAAQGDEKKLNVILVSVESLSAEFLTAFGSQENITPFMDEWFEQGLLFTRFYATGTRTTRGLEALTLSLPPTPGRSIVKRPDNASMFSLGKVFKDKGYDTVFLYGGNGYFDNMNAFFSGNSYRTVDQTDLNAEEIHFENAWGVADDDLLMRAVKEADADYLHSQPFFFHIMTTSNHRPYTYPAGKIDIPSGKGGRSGGVKFTDYALKEFMTVARTKPWFDNTVFVVVADHCAGSARKAALPVDKYHIPLFIYAPSHIKPAKIDTLSSQIDVAPTLLSLLNFGYDSEFFGRDILRMKTEEGRALIGNYQKLGLFKDNKLVYLAPQQQIVVVDDPLNTAQLLDPISVQPLVQENMAYYQSADYIWNHRLNRIEGVTTLQ